ELGRVTPAYLAADERHALLAPAIHVRTGVQRIVQDIEHRAVVWTRPVQLSRRDTDGHLQAMTTQVAHDGARAAVEPEALEDEPHDALDLLVVIESQPAIFAPNVTCRRFEDDFSAARFTQLAALEAQPHPVSLRVGELPLEAEQQPVVVVVRVVDDIL